jgi:hypothetical protein
MGAVGDGYGSSSSPLGVHTSGNYSMRNQGRASPINSFLTLITTTCTPHARGGFSIVFLFFDAGQLPRCTLP